MKPQFEIPDNCTMPRVVISGRFHGNKTFPSLNNLLAEYAKHPRAGNRMKQTHQETSTWLIRSQLGHWKASKPLILHYRFFEPAKGQKRDVMNIFSMADKIVEDALQDAKVIPDDSPKWVKNSTHDFYYTDGEPYIEVFLEEIDED